MLTPILILLAAALLLFVLAGAINAREAALGYVVTDPAQQDRLRRSRVWRSCEIDRPSVVSASYADPHLDHDTTEDAAATAYWEGWPSRYELLRDIAQAAAVIQKIRRSEARQLAQRRAVRVRVHLRGVAA